MPTAIGAFSVSDFTPTDYASEVTTALGTGHAHMVKTFTGAVEGRSLTQFSFAFSQETGVGTYVAMEAFEGEVDGRRGTFNFAHSATTTGSDRSDEFFLIVPNSGTGELAGITGTGSIVMDADGERMVFDYSL
ncbi:MAG TPA: DUF3224 domain-containing protein [Acidimicrobiia bacterium]|jgi:hypothetical protein